MNKLTIYECQSEIEHNIVRKLGHPSSMVINCDDICSLSHMLDLCRVIELNNAPHITLLRADSLSPSELMGLIEFISKKKVSLGISCKHSHQIPALFIRAFCIKLGVEMLTIEPHSLATAA